MRVAMVRWTVPDQITYHLDVTLQRMGHTVVLVDDFPWLHYGHPLSRFMLPLLSKHHRFESYRCSRIARRVVESHPDLFIAPMAWLRPESVEQIKQGGAKTVLLYPDHIANLGRQYLLISAFDLLVFKDPYAVRLFRDKLGIPVHYLPEACNPSCHRSVSLTPEEMSFYGCDITTAGTMYPYRTRLLEVLEGYDIKLWGKPWPGWMESPLRQYHMGTAVRLLEKAKAFRAAKIVVNTLHYAEIEGVNCRTFEVAGCGGFQICCWKPALQDLFEPDREIVTFVSREELKSKVDYYLDRPEERERIAELGRIRAHRDHTYEVRINQIFELVFHAK